MQLKRAWPWGGGEGGVWGGPGQKVSVNRAFLQPGLQRLAGLVELVDAVYEDLQSCYGVYASLFHRWGPGLLLPLKPALQVLPPGPGDGGEQVSEMCSLQHHQDRLLHSHLPAAGASGEAEGWGEASWLGRHLSFLVAGSLTPPFWAGG